MNKVLIIDDCRFQGIILKDMLEKLGYETNVIGEIYGLENIEKQPPDIVFVNYIMKDVTGDVLIEKIKEKCPNIKCVLCSSNIIFYADYKDRKVDAVIHTPVDKDKLIRVLKKINLDESENSNFQKKLDKKEASSVPKFKFCPYCGSKLNDNSNGKCPKCVSELKS
ncbi:MAG: response regulator [Bacillota bacterium]|nr:response regulator [Bacillota bacterium]